MVNDISPYWHSTCSTMPPSMSIGNALPDYGNMINESSYISIELNQMKINRLEEDIGLWILVEKR